MRYHCGFFVFAGLLALLSGVPSAHAIQAEAEGSASQAGANVPSRPFELPALDVQPSLLVNAQNETLLQSRIAPFQQRYGGTWEIRWDERGNRPNVVQGSGIALIPGRGNSLSPKLLGLNSAAELTLETVAGQVRKFIDSIPELLQADALELRLDSERSVGTGEGNSLWAVEFNQMHQGVPVDGAFIYARISHGNIVQFGAERVAPVRIGAKPSLSRDQAFERAWSELGFPATAHIQEFVQRGELRIYPTLLAGEAKAMPFSGIHGNGYGHLLAWRYVFRLEGDPATWQVLVDAQTNRVVDVRDLTTYVAAKVRGGIYPVTNLDPEVVVDFPFTAVANGTTKVTDALGIYDYSGGSATVALDGKYYKIVDNCGSISLSNNSDGNLNLGTSGGTDCTTPGVGGAGNTHAARSGFYHLTKINQKARTFLTTNAWLQGKVTANMNINQTCNANWNLSTLNFFKSGPHPTATPTINCGNTGELAAVFLHEWGHGMDSNSGGAANEAGTGEAVGDTFAFLETRDSCIGEGFYTDPGKVCYNCTTCSGVRDVADFSLSAPAAKLATPANLGNDAGINCDRLACPYLVNGFQPYQGPMGYEGHCESYIASTANWDLKNALVANFGEAGWGKLDRIWYSSLTPSKSAYRVASGGQCNTAASVDGCGATNWYTVFLSSDDDDGNLANGTPNACRIWDAYNSHGIACGTRPACTDAGTPDFNLTVSNSPQSVCAPANATFNLNVASNGGFSNAVTLAASGQPAGTSVAFSPNPVTPGGTATLTVSDTGAATPGTSTLTINGTASGSPGHSATATLTLGSGAPAAPGLTAPANNATGVASNVSLTWAAVAGAQSYTVEVAGDAGFNTLVASQSGVTGTSWAPAGLAASTTYYWRVRASSDCGAGGNSVTFSFTTSAAPVTYCRTPASAIPDNTPSGVSDSLSVATTGALTDLRLSVDLTHTYVGDLNLVLSKGATSVMLMQRPGNASNTGGSGCNGNNMDVVIDDAATLTLEGNCSADPNPAFTTDGSYKPNNPLTPFVGQDLSGNWTLQAVDAAGQDVGTLNNWCLLPALQSGPTDVIFANGFQ